MSEIDKQLLKKRFSKSATTYDQYASIQKKMADNLLQYLLKENSLSNIQDMLDIGCGTGYLTSKLADAFPTAKITALDIADGMLEMTQKRVSNKEIIQLVQADIEEQPLRTFYDLMVSNATFQWFNHFPATLKHLLQHLNAGGRLYFTTFGQDTFQELHQSFKQAFNLLNLNEDIAGAPSLIGPSFLTLKQVKEICEQVAKPLGSFIIQADEQIHHLSYSDVRTFLDAVKKAGANNHTVGQMLRPSLLKKMIEIYNKTYRGGDGIQVTYQTMYVCLKKEG